MTNPDRSVEEWEIVAANIALKSHKLSKNYAPFSECIYQGVKEIIQAERQKRKEMVEEVYGHFSWCRECEEGPTCSEALAIKEKYGITQPNNK